MIRIRMLFVLIFALASLAMGATIIETTPLYNNWGGTSDCSSGAVTTCSYSNWWNNGTRQDISWSEVGGYDGITSVSTGKSTSETFNWGNSWGSSFSTNDSGGGWNTSDQFSQYTSDWTGQSLDSNGYGNTWGGADSQANHTLLNSISVWSCNGANCHQEDYWWSTNQYDYSATGWWSSALFGVNYNSGTWQNAFSLFTPDSGHHSYDWNRWPDQTSGVPEPATYGLIGASLTALAIARRRPF